MMCCDQPRFHREDASYHRIPKNARRDDPCIGHFGYPTRDAERDPNCVLQLASSLSRTYVARITYVSSRL